MQMLPLTMLGLPAAEASPAPAQGEAGFELALLMAASPGDATSTEALSGTSQDAGADQPIAAADEQDLDETRSETLASLALVSLLAPVRPQASFEQSGVPTIQTSDRPIPTPASGGEAPVFRVAAAVVTPPRPEAQSVPVAVVKPIPGSAVTFEDWTPSTASAAAVTKPIATPQGGSPIAPAAPAPPVASLKASSLAADFMAGPLAERPVSETPKSETSPAGAIAASEATPATDRAVIVKPTLIPQTALVEVPLPGPATPATYGSDGPAVTPATVEQTQATSIPHQPFISRSPQADLKAMAPVTTQAVKQVLGDDHLAASDVGIATVMTEAVKQVLTTIPSEEEVPAETLPPSPGLVQVQAPKTAIQAARGASLVQKLLQKLNHAFEPPASTDAPETSYDPAPKAVVNQTLPAGPAPIPAVEVAAPRDVAPTKAVIMISPSPEAALPMAPSAGPAEIAKEQSEPQFELGDGLSAEDKPSIEIPILDETLEAPLPVSTKEAAATVRTPEKTSGTDRPEPLQRAAEEISDVLALRLPGRVTIRLNPEELGSLTIVVKHSAGQVSAEISATNDAVRAQLSSHRHELAASLEQRGHQLSSFQVTAEPPASSLSDKGQQFSQHSQSQPHLQKEDFERMARLAQASHPAVPQSRLSPHSSGVNVLA